MARSRAGRVSKSASQTLPVRGTQPRPLIGVRTVQTMITNFSRQNTPGPDHGGEQAGRFQVPHDQFQVQPVQHEQQQLDLSTQQAQNTQAQLDSGQDEMEVADTRDLSDTLDPGSDVVNPLALPVAENAPGPGHLQEQLGVAEGEPDLEYLDLELSDRVRPPVPDAEPLAQGWESIRRLGGWQVTVSHVRRS